MIYKCPFCSDKKDLIVSALDFRNHVKRLHKNKGKSGTCPFDSCHHTFGNIQDFIEHVDKSRNIQKLVSDGRDKKKKNTIENTQPKKKFASELLLSTSFSQEHDNISSEAHETINNPDPVPIASNFTKRFCFDELLSRSGSHHHSSDNDEFDANSFVLKIPTFSDFKEKSPSDLELLNFRKKQCETASAVVVELLANVTQTRSDVKKLLLLLLIIKNHQLKL